MVKFPQDRSPSTASAATESPLTAAELIERLQLGGGASRG
jgi:hypothetical protein